MPNCLGVGSIKSVVYIFRLFQRGYDGILAQPVERHDQDLASLSAGEGAEADYGVEHPFGHFIGVAGLVAAAEALAASAFKVTDAVTSLMVAAVAL
jgi:hypothetical protein